jgi:uncharacterized lipoprotein
MKVAVLLVLAVFAATLAGCDRVKEPANKPKTEVQKRAEAPPSPTGAPVPSVLTQSGPQGPISAKENRDGNTPVQGQVDSRETPQRQDFDKK